MISTKSIELTRAPAKGKGKIRYIIDDNECLAEEAAIFHYKSLGYKASWTENIYWWILTSLLFWDVIFAKVEGAIGIVVDGVRTEMDVDDERFDRLFEESIKMNGMPADMFSEEFFERRRSLLENRVKELQNTVHLPFS